MFVVDHVLVSDELLDAPFSCNLGACRGACCVQGDSGAPLEPEEREEVEKVLPRVRQYLRPEALRVIDREGVWEEIAPGRYATTCVGEAECVFVTYDGPVAKCAIQKAFFEGRVDFEKPISCHLFPIRVQDYGDLEVLNYEQISLCDPARKHGQRTGMQAADYLRRPLVRRYGEDWYERFRDACESRRVDLAPSAGDDLSKRKKC
jgi:hypothetical protein